MKEIPEMVLYNKPKVRKRRVGLSKLASTIKDWLTHNDILFEQEKTFAGLINVSSLRFDYYLLDYNVVIEAQGEQHYTSVRKWGGKAGLAKRQLLDRMKVDFCDIPGNPDLLEIRYDQISEVDDILSAYLRV